MHLCLPPFVRALEACRLGSHCLASHRLAHASLPRQWRERVSEYEYVCECVSASYGRRRADVPARARREGHVPRSCYPLAMSRSGRSAVRVVRSRCSPESVSADSGRGLGPGAALAPGCGTAVPARPRSTFLAKRDSPGRARVHCAPREAKPCRNRPGMPARRPSRRDGVAACQCVNMSRLRPGPACEPPASVGASVAGVAFSSAPASASASASAHRSAAQVSLSAPVSSPPLPVACPAESRSATIPAPQPRHVGQPAPLPPRQSPSVHLRPLQPRGCCCVCFRIAGRRPASETLPDSEAAALDRAARA